MTDMSESDLGHHPKPGTEEYDRHVREEIEHYGRIYLDQAAQERLMQPVPSAWVEAETRASALIRQSTGNDLVGHLLERLCARPGTRMLSLGSGPGGIEIELARKAPEAEVVCVDINPDLLRLGRQRAEALALGLAVLAAIVLPILYLRSGVPIYIAVLESLPSLGTAGALTLLLSGESSFARRATGVTVFCVFNVGFYVLLMLLRLSRRSIL